MKRSQKLRSFLTKFQWKLTLGILGVATFIVALRESGIYNQEPTPTSPDTIVETIDTASDKLDASLDASLDALLENMDATNDLLRSNQEELNTIFDRIEGDLKDINGGGER